MVDFQGIICGASLIGSSHLSTAAHCVKDSEVDQYTISLGDHNIFIRDGESLYDVDKLICHPVSDIAIIKLKIPADQRVTPNEKYIIDYVRLPDSKDFDVNEVPIIAGWGYESPVELPSPNLKFFKSKYREVDEFTVIIVGGATCYGDSGSGWVYQRNESFHLVGGHEGAAEMFDENFDCTADDLAVRADKKMDAIRSLMGEE